MSPLLMDKMVEASAACATLAVGCVVLYLTAVGALLVIKKWINEQDRFPTQEETDASVYRAIQEWRREQIAAKPADIDIPPDKKIGPKSVKSA